jgi:hypothetical protein
MQGRWPERSNGFNVAGMQYPTPARNDQPPHKTHDQVRDWSAAKNSQTALRHQAVVRIKVHD